MTKYEKYLEENPAMKTPVIQIMNILNGESVVDCKQILDAVNYYVHGNSMFDAELAKDIVNQIVEGD